MINLSGDRGSSVLESSQGGSQPDIRRRLGEESPAQNNFPVEQSTQPEISARGKGVDSQGNFPVPVLADSLPATEASAKAPDSSLIGEARESNNQKEPNRTLEDSDSRGGEKFIWFAFLAYFGSWLAGMILDGVFNVEPRSIYWALGIVTGWISAILVAKSIKT